MALFFVINHFISFRVFSISILITIFPIFVYLKFMGQFILNFIMHCRLIITRKCSPTWCQIAYLDSAMDSFSAICYQSALTSQNKISIIAVSPKGMGPLWEGYMCKENKSMVLASILSTRFVHLRVCGRWWLWVWERWWAFVHIWGSWYMTFDGFFLPSCLGWWW